MMMDQLDSYINSHVTVMDKKEVGLCETTAKACNSDIASKKVVMNSNKCKSDIDLVQNTTLCDVELTQLGSSVKSIESQGVKSFFNGKVIVSDNSSIEHSSCFRRLESQSEVNALKETDTDCNISTTKAKFNFQLPAFSELLGFANSRPQSVKRKKLQKLSKTEKKVLKCLEDETNVCKPNYSLSKKLEPNVQTENSPMNSMPSDSLLEMGISSFAPVKEILCNTSDARLFLEKDMKHINREPSCIMSNSFSSTISTTPNGLELSTFDSNADEGKIEKTVVKVNPLSHSSKEAMNSEVNSLEKSSQLCKVKQPTLYNSSSKICIQTAKSQGTDCKYLTYDNLQCEKKLPYQDQILDAKEIKNPVKTLKKTFEKDSCHLKNLQNYSVTEFYSLPFFQKLLLSTDDEMFFSSTSDNERTNILREHKLPESLQNVPLIDLIKDYVKFHLTSVAGSAFKVTDVLSRRSVMRYASEDLKHCEGIYIMWAFDEIGDNVQIADVIGNLVYAGVMKVFQEYKSLVFKFKANNVKKNCATEVPFNVSGLNATICNDIVSELPFGILFNSVGVSKS